MAYCSLHCTFKSLSLVRGGLGESRAVQRRREERGDCRDWVDVFVTVAPAFFLLPSLACVAQCFCYLPPSPMEGSRESCESCGSCHVSVAYPLHFLRDYWGDHGRPVSKLETLTVEWQTYRHTVRCGAVHWGEGKEVPTLVLHSPWSEGLGRSRQRHRNS